MSAIVVAGTDTGIGKTVFSAGLCAALSAVYWKPIQSGLEEDTDSQTVARLAGTHCLPEAYRLQLPASPHLSAEAEGVEIDPSRLDPPAHDAPLVIEGTGGLMVPLNRNTLYLDVIADWGLPVALCASTRLGTINHTLLSLEALRTRGCRILGVAFIGEPEPAAEETIAQMGRIRKLGRLAQLSPLTPETLLAAMAELDLAPLREALA